MEDRKGCAALLTCPVCGQPLGDAEGSARCAAGHSFDYARSGYLNLARPGRPGGRAGDTAEMVRARREFLAAGHFEPVAAAVAAAGVMALSEVDGPMDDGARVRSGAVAVEIGAGTGHYLAALAGTMRGRGEPLRCGAGLDLSKAAANRAARDYPDLRFVVADVEEAIPLVDEAADLVLSAFAPRPGPELGRIIRHGGGLVIAFAGPGHLRGLRERLGLIGIHADKLDQLVERLASWFELTATTDVEYEVELSEKDARRLVLMGPNAHHDVDLAPLADGHSDFVSVTVTRFRRR